VTPAHPLLSTPERQPAEAVSLTALAPGEGGLVAHVESDSGIGRRLLDLGFIPGTELRVIRRAPLGDPVTFELRGTRICLRRSEAARITIFRSHPDGSPRS
jgi:Fe2+ transport system protein FeoA